MREFMELYQKLSDEELVLLLNQGDERAYTEIFERFHSLLYIYAYKKLEDTQEAQDVVQEVLIALWKNRTALSLNGSLSVYLYTAVRNRAFDVFAHRKVKTVHVNSLGQYLQQAENSTDFLIREKELKTLIDTEIAALPERMRLIFELSRTQHLSRKEIAELLSLSEHTVDTQMKRALKILRRRLGLLTWLLMLTIK